MCDFSLANARSRKAAVGDRLVSHNFGTGTRGFADIKDSGLAVCVVPGTEIGFDRNIKTIEIASGRHKDTGYATAIFRQVNKDKASAHHDALELPDGNIVLLTVLAEGQHAAVLQLPATPTNKAEADEQQRLEVVG